EYGYIFGTQQADVDLRDVVLQRRILVVMIPALEKSGDEAANLGKIVVAALKGMMGSTLGAQIEGERAQIIDNKMTQAPSPFPVVFDEVGYYATEGMGVMAAQARSLGFSLIFAAQDLPAMEKRVKEEARSITGNCNLKIFGKLEDPTDTKDFFDKSMSKHLVAEVTGHSTQAGFFGTRFMDQQNTSLKWTEKTDYNSLRAQGPGEATLMYGNTVISAKMLFSAPEKTKALRVHKLLPVVPPAAAATPRDRSISEVAARFADPEWTAASGGPPLPTSREIEALVAGHSLAVIAKRTPLECGAMAVAHLATLPPIMEETTEEGSADFDPFATPADAGSGGGDFDLKSFWESLPTELGGNKNPFMPETPATATPTLPPKAAVPESVPPSFNKIADDFFARHFGTAGEPVQKDGAAKAEVDGDIEVPPYTPPPSVTAIMEKTARSLEEKLFERAEDQD
nr:TraM recognition domain-containing protein [Pseudomonadota bacterium]